MEEEEDDDFVTSLSFGDGIELRMVWLRDEMEGIGNMERDNFLASYLRHVFVSFAPSLFFDSRGEHHIRLVCLIVCITKSILPSAFVFPLFPTKSIITEVFALDPFHVCARGGELVVQLAWS